MRNIVILNSLHFSYPLPILMRVSYNTLIVKQNTSDYYKYKYYFLGFVCAGLQNEKFSYAELFSLSFWGAGSVSFRILAGADIEIFLKDFPEVFPIAETGSFCYFSHGIFPFFQ